MYRRNFSGSVRVAFQTTSMTWRLRLSTSVDLRRLEGEILGQLTCIVVSPIIAARGLRLRPSGVETCAASAPNTRVCIVVHASTPLPNSRDDSFDFHPTLRSRASSSCINLNLTMRSVLLFFNVSFACETNDLLFALSKSSPSF